ncbi:MAG TPA: ABC transporter permease [Pirellulales bacterium]|nr:ABC transporter permease [Pirellulales bacterium]
MSLWKIAWRSIQQRALASSLTSVSMGLGVALVVAVLVLQAAVTDSFQHGGGLGYDMIVGAKGSKLQLVLNTVYYLSSPVENIPWSYYKEFTDGKFKRYVEKAVPCCLGDYYEEYRVVGTTPEMFELKPPSGKGYTCAAGEIFHSDDFFTAVVGSTVASTTGLTVGSKFQPTHGAPGGHQHDPFTVVGVLAPTGTPNDRAVFVNIEGFYLLDNHAKEPEPAEETQQADADHAHAGADHAEDHAPESAMDHEHAAEDKDAAAHEEHDAADQDHAAEGEHAEHAHEDEHGHDHEHEHGEHHHAPLPENQREVTAILLLTASAPGVPAGLSAMPLIKQINKGSVAQVVLPIREIRTLLDLFVAPLEWLLLALTVLIVVVAGVGILVSIYNSMSERRREIAIMRALGASRESVMLIVLLESILLALAGGMLGWLLGHGLLGVLAPWIGQEAGVNLAFWHATLLELVIIPGLVVLAAVVGFLPAVVAYRTDVAKALVAAP